MTAADLGTAQDRLIAVLGRLARCAREFRTIGRASMVERGILDVCDDLSDIAGDLRAAVDPSLDEARPT